MGELTNTAHALCACRSNRPVRTKTLWHSTSGGTAPRRYATSEIALHSIFWQSV